MIRSIVLLSCGVGLTSTLLAQDSHPIGSWKAVRSTHGDTLVVRTISGSIWGDKVRLVEELRIGTKEGDGPDAFGNLRSFAMFSDGVMAVFDQSVPALRLFDPAGKYLRTIGRNGAGPGEYRNDVLGLAVDRDGVLIMYDLRNARLNRWKEDGTVLPAWPWVSASTLYAFSHALQIDTSGNTYILIAAERLQPGKDVKKSLARLDRNGKLADTLQQPLIAGADDPPVVPFSPYKQWFLTRAGGVVTAFTGVYSITLSEPRRGAVRIEREAAQVALLPEERKSYEGWSAARSGAPGVSTAGPASRVPSVKPYFTQMLSDLDGRIWVQLHTNGEEFDPAPVAQRPGSPPMPTISWRERTVWDVFQPDGAFLGQIELPRGATLNEAKGDRIWTIVRGEDDEQYIVRYRIVRNP